MKFDMGLIYMVPFLLILTVFSSSESAAPKLVKSQDHMKMLRLDRESGLDGKVKSVRFNSEAETELEPDDFIPGIRAYGIRRSKLESEPEPDFKILFESRLAEEADEPGLGDPRSKPSIEAYKPKIIGRIERIPLGRAKRSFEKSFFNELDDLQVEEAKVFPAFIRLQTAGSRKIQKPKSQE